MGKRPVRNPPTRKHEARARRERRLSRLFILGVGIVLLAVAVLIGYGVFDARVLAPKRPVATVNGIGVPADVVRDNLQVLVQSGGDPQTAASTALQQAIDDVLVETEADARGIAVSDEEIETTIQRAFGYFPDGTPTPAPTRTPDAVALTATAQAPIPTEGPLATATANATPAATATPYTYDGFRTAFEDYLAQAGISETRVREVIRISLLRSALQEAMAEDVPREQEQVSARHILVANEAEALGVLQRLDAGEFWDALAAEVSLDASNKDQGGDLGWFGQGAMVAPFEEAAFAGEVGTVVGPVETSFGWHLIRIDGRETRPMDEFEYQMASINAFESWLADVRAKAEIQIEEDWLATVQAAIGG